MAGFYMSFTCSLGIKFKYCTIKNNSVEILNSQMLLAMLPLKFCSLSHFFPAFFGNSGVCVATFFPNAIR